jgi:hypothetical protein
LVQRFRSIAFQEFSGEYFEYVTIGIINLRLVIVVVAVLEQGSFPGSKSCGLLYFGKILFYFGAKGKLGYGPVGIFILLLDIRNDPVNAIRLRVIPVKAKFILYIKYKKKTEADANSKPKDVQEVIPFVFSEIADRNQEEVFYHGYAFSLFLTGMAWIISMPIRIPTF